MKEATKKILAGALACSMMLSSVAALTLNNVVAKAEEEAPASHTFVDFKTDVSRTHSEVLTNVDTDGDGTVDAANAFKALYADRGDKWIDYNFTLPQAPDLTGKTKLCLRLYVHMSEATSTCSVVWMKNGAQDPMLWGTTHKQGEWYTYEISGADLAKLNSNTFTIMIFPGDNPTLYEDSYVLLDKMYLVDENSTETMVTDFNGSDFTVVDKSCMAVDTDGDGVIDAKNVMKIPVTGTDWRWNTLVFPEAPNMTDIGKIVLRVYPHISSATSTHSILYMRNSAGTDMMFKADYTEGEWVDLVIDSEADVAKFNSNSVQLGIYPGDNATLYEDSYILIDKITLVEKELPKATVTLDNDTATTGAENTEVKVKIGQTMTNPGSQVQGMKVKWYSDAAKTTLFDFSTVITEDITLYGKYEALEKGLLVEMNEEDSAIWLNAPGKPEPQCNWMGADSLSYITNVDMDGDGTIEEESALKINYTGQWQLFGVQLFNSLDMTNIASVTFHLYFHTNNMTTYTLWGGEGNPDGPYTGSFVGWAAQPQGEWIEVTVSAPDQLAKMTGEDGKFDSFTIGTGFGWDAIPDQNGKILPDSYMLIGRITYNWNCNVVYEMDTATSGIENVTQVISNGKKLGVIPEDLEAAITAKGYTVEWYTDAAKTQAFDLKKDRINEDITLYAKLTKVETPSDSTTDSTKPADSTTDSTKPADSATNSTSEKKGCFSGLEMSSAIALGAIAIATIGCMVLLRKKED